MAIAMHEALLAQLKTVRHVRWRTDARAAAREPERWPESAREMEIRFS